MLIQRVTDPLICTWTKNGGVLFTERLRKTGDQCVNLVMAGSISRGSTDSSQPRNILSQGVPRDEAIQVIPAPMSAPGAGKPAD